jgi:hypothetical protein
LQRAAEESDGMNKIGSSAITGVAADIAGSMTMVGGPSP